MSPRLGVVIDQERCLGCESCTVACKIENNPTAGSWLRVEAVAGERKERYPALRLDFLPVMCQHCAQPSCREACPPGALYQREDGLVLLDSNKCNGCQACVSACPYEAIQYSPQKGIVEKCHFCVHRIDQGLEPFCVVCCEGQAMHFGDLDDAASEVSRLIAARRAVILKPEAGTRPAVYYCPPRQRRKL